MELITIQNNLKKQLEKSKMYFDESPKHKLTKSYIETRLQSIEAKWTEYTKNHYEILKREELLETSYVKEDSYEKMEEFYIGLKSDLKDFLDKYFGTPNQDYVLSDSHSFNTNSCGQGNLKLPKLVIPVFSGKYTEWVSFRNLFISLVHNNNSIDDVQKLLYLKGHLSGEAEQLVRHISITKDNYLQCWSMLESRYDNKQYLVNCLLNGFFYKKKISTESATAIKDLLNCTLEMLNGMKGLGVDIESWDILIIYIVSLKLDSETRKLWELNVSKELSDSNKLPNFTQFKTFLEKRFHSLEFLDTKINADDRKHANAGISKVVTMLGTETPMLCSYCVENHKLSNCKDFLKLECNAKRQFVRENRICFNCLALNHTAKYCRSINCCRICGRRHHSFLHSNVANSLVEGQNKIVNKKLLTFQEQDNSNSCSNFPKDNLKHILLPTALVDIDTCKKNRQSFRALIDQGSQVSYVTDAVVRQLGLKKETMNSKVAILGNGQSVRIRAMVSLKVRSSINKNFIKTVKAYVLDKITSPLPQTKVQPLGLILKSVKLADPGYYNPDRIDILLGAGVYSSIIKDGLIKSPTGAAVAQNTTLGWIVSGEVQLSTSDC